MDHACMNVLSFAYLGLVGGVSVVLWLSPRKLRWFFTALGNMAFLYLLRPSRSACIFLLILLVYTWLSGLAMRRYPVRAGAFLLAAGALAGLCWFKYGGLLTGTSMVMPLGISFFSFKAVSYIVDVERQEVEAALNPIKVFDYLYFFPTFQAGPIHKSKRFFEETDRPFVFDYTDQKNGCIQAGLGLFEKLVIADYFSGLVKLFLNPELTGWYTIFGMFLYGLHLYTDFDAYSNIAIGSARMMGYHMDANFRAPYLSVSLRDFWRRWHISLGTWLKDYVYIPLGGSRHGNVRKWLNTVIVFAVSGLWHGSTVMFLYWGLGHGVLSAIEDMIRTVFGKHRFRRWLRMAAIPFGIVINFILVTVLWVFFRSASMAEALAVFASMRNAIGSVASISYEAAGMTLNEWNWAWILMAALFAGDLLRSRTDLAEWLSRRNFLIRWSFYILLMLVAIIFGVYGPGYDPQNFIYVTF